MQIPVRVKKLHPLAKIPAYQTAGAACFDLHALYSSEVLPGHATPFSTGLAFEIPEGFVMQVFSRSGHGFKHRVSLGNGTGIIDADYRGEVQVMLANDGDRLFKVAQDDRIAQAMIVPIPQVALIEADELTETSRGVGGLGSTGV